MKTGFLPAMLAYAAVIWAAGLRPSRLKGGLDAFFLASRALGPARVAFSLCASWIGAASLLVSTDEASRDGLSAIWIIGVPAVATLLILAALARPVRASAGLTLSELMGRSYGRFAETATTVLIVWYMTVLAASQLVAAGPFLSVFLGTGPVLGMAAAVVVVMAYSAAGGLQAVARTHVVQFVLLIAGVAGMAVHLAGRVSWDAVKTAAAGLGKSSYFDVLAGGSRSLLIAVSFVLAWTISPIAWQRMQAARTEAAARGGAGLAALILGFFYAAIVAVGLLFLPFFAESETGVPLVTRFAASASGPFLGGLVFVTVLAAILSTTDAALNAGAFTLTKGLLGRRGGRPETAAPGRGPLRLARLSSLALAAAALLIAVRLGDVLKTLGLASTIMAEGLLVPGLAALFLKRRAPLAGLLSLILGGGYAVAGFLAESGLSFISVPPWPRSLPLGLGLGTAGFLSGLLFERVPGRRARPAPPGA